MTLSLLLPMLLLGQATSDANSVAPAASQAGEASPVERHRAPVDVLTERMIGSASRAVRFDWRQSTVGFGLLGGELLERNNFGSNRFGLLLRKPVSGFMLELSAARVSTWGTQGSRNLAMTPYRQAGRPSRWEFDVTASLPLVEGVVTAWPRFVPPLELVLSFDLSFRYLFYPGSLGGRSFGRTLGALFSPKMDAAEIQKLESKRLPGMELDTARYHLMTGLHFDIYFQNGIFLSPRALVALPLLSPANGTKLGFWWELTFAAGWAF